MLYIYKILFKTSVPENTRESSYTISWIYTSSSISLNEGGCQRPFTGWCCSKQTGPRHGTPEMARLPVDRQVDCWTDQGVTRLVASQGRPERSIHPRSPTGQPLRLDPTLNGLRTPRRTAARAAPPNAPNGSSGPRSRPRGGGSSAIFGSARQTVSTAKCAYTISQIESDPRKRTRTKPFPLEVQAQILDPCRAETTHPQLGCPTSKPKE